MDAVCGKTYAKKGVVPGFGITLGFTLVYLSLIVLIPLSALWLRAAGTDWNDIVRTVTDARFTAAFRLSFLTSLFAALINALFGIIVAWVLVRYRFPGRKMLDAMVDLPFALPTAVAGIALTTLYAENGLIGHWLASHGIRIAFTSWGICIALVFVGLPFVVRTLEPVIGDFDRELEEASLCLGATRKQTFFRVILPQLFPTLMTGFAMALARALGEYGSVIFIAGNMPFKTEIVPLLIMIKLEQYDYNGAAVLAIVMLSVSFALLLLINILQSAARNRSRAS